MKKRLYIHIGFPKTGSSAIQSFLLTNQKILKEHGIFYPAPLVGKSLKSVFHVGHGSMVQADSYYRYDLTPWHEYRDQYFAALQHSGCDVHILSAEALVYENPQLDAFLCGQT